MSFMTLANVLIALRYKWNVLRKMEIAFHGRFGVLIILIPRQAECGNLTVCVHDIPGCFV